MATICDAALGPVRDPARKCANGDVITRGYGNIRRKHGAFLEIVFCGQQGAKRADHPKGAECRKRIGKPHDAECYQEVDVTVHSKKEALKIHQPEGHRALAICRRPSSGLPKLPPPMSLREKSYWIDTYFAQFLLPANARVS